MTTTTPLPEREQQAREVWREALLVEAERLGVSIPPSEDLIVKAMIAFADAPRPTSKGTLAENVRYILDNEPLAVRVHEGGCAEEDLASSLAVTWLKLQNAARPRPTSAPVVGELPQDRHGETALDRVRDLADSGTLDPQLRADLKAILAREQAASPPSEVLEALRDTVAIITGDLSGPSQVAGVLAEARALIAEHDAMGGR